MRKFVGIAGPIYCHGPIIPVTRKRSSMKIFKLTHYRKMWSYTSPFSCPHVWPYIGIYTTDKRGGGIDDGWAGFGRLGANCVEFWVGKCSVMLHWR